MRHDPLAGSQNLGNSLDLRSNRSCVRQTHFYRLHESGNAAKEAMGLGSTKWDLTQKEGAFLGQRIEDPYANGRAFHQEAKSSAPTTRNNHDSRTIYEKEATRAGELQQSQIKPQNVQSRHANQPPPPPAPVTSNVNTRAAGNFPRTKSGNHVGGSGDDDKSHFQTTSGAYGAFFHTGK